MVSFFPSRNDSNETITVENDTLNKSNEDSNSFGTSQSLLNEDAKNTSGNSTDQDDTLPRIKIGIKFKPTVILSSLTATSRSPIVESWVMHLSDRMESWMAEAQEL